MTDRLNEQDNLDDADNRGNVTVARRARHGAEHEWVRGRENPASNTDPPPDPIGRTPTIVQPIPTTLPDSAQMSRNQPSNRERAQMPMLRRLYHRSPIIAWVGLVAIALLLAIGVFLAVTWLRPSSAPTVAENPAVPAQDGAAAPGATAAPASEPPAASAPAQPKPTQAPPAAPALPALVVANTDGEGVFLRRTPKMDDRLVAWPDGTRLQPTGETSSAEGREWLQVRDPKGAVAWVPSEFTASAQNAAVAVGQPLVVGNTEGQGVFLRRTPKLDDRLIAWPDGTELQPTGQIADGEGQRWVEVRDPKGNVGWVPAQYVPAQ